MPFARKRNTFSLVCFLVPMMYVVFQESDCPDVWVAESVDLGTGGTVYTVTFLGPDAESRAREYAEWQNRSKGKKSAAVQAA